jgi:hypothetical protein
MTVQYNSLPLLFPWYIVYPVHLQNIQFQTNSVRVDVSSTEVRSGALEWFAILDPICLRQTKALLCG